MSLRDEIRAELIDLDVKDIRVFKDGNVKGRPAVNVHVFMVEDHDGVPVETEHIFWFAKDNNMDAHHMATVVDSYIRKQPGKDWA